MNKKDIVACGSSLYRVLSIKDGKTLVIDCLQPKMPYWAELDSGEIRCSDEQELYERTKTENIYYITKIQKKVYLTGGVSRQSPIFRTVNAL